MLISILNFIALWDGVEQNERTGVPTLNLSGRRPVFLLCAICEIGVLILMLSYIFPTEKSVARLSERWERLYAGNQTLAIKSLQDVGNCCGLASLTDKAWPFENNGACHHIYNREESCLSSWSESQNLTAVLIIVVMSVPLMLKGVIMAMSILFTQKIHPLIGMHNEISILEKDLESGLYNLENVSSIKANSRAGVSASRKAPMFRNRNTLVNHF